MAVLPTYWGLFCIFVLHNIHQLDGSSLPNKLVAVLQIILGITRRSISEATKRGESAWHYARDIAFPKATKRGHSSGITRELSIEATKRGLICVTAANLPNKGRSCSADTFAKACLFCESACVSIWCPFCRTNPRYRTGVRSAFCALRQCTTHPCLSVLGV